MKSQCMTGSPVVENQRNEMIEMRKYPGSGYFYSTMIRNGSYKLIINGTRSAANRQIAPFSGYWLNPVVTVPLYTPDEAGYAQLSTDSMFRSSCYEAMDDNATFDVVEYMLFDVEMDPIEACNLFDAMPDVANALLDRLMEAADDYEGGGVTPPLPEAFDASINAWNCDLNCYANGSYDAESCYGLSTVTPWLDMDGETIIVAESNWTKIFESMIDVAEDCAVVPTDVPTSMPTVDKSGVVDKFELFGMGLMTVSSIWIL